MDLSAILMLAVFIGACFLAAFAGAAFRPDAWYDQLKKPTWQPPKWLFAPVWTVLYLMIATSGWLVWLQAGFVAAAFPLAIFALQLVLNAAWTPVFFGLRRLGLGFFVIVLVWLAIIWTIVLFKPISGMAALLLVPYLAWVSFATVLNFTLWRLNSASETKTE